MIRLAIEPAELFVGRPSELVLSLLNEGPLACLQIACKLDLPESFAAVEGGGEIEIDRLEPAESARFPIEVKPRREGDWSLGVRGLSFWDGNGSLQRIEELRRPVTVTPAPEERAGPLARLRVDITANELRLREWSRLRGRVRHLGGEALTRLAVRATGRVHGDPDRPWRELTPLEERGETGFSLEVRAPEGGAAVPVCVEARFVDRLGREGRAVGRGTVEVSAGAPSAGRREETETPRSGALVPILVLLANPVDTQPLRLGAEARDLEEELKRSKERDRFSLTVRQAVRAIDVSRAILESRPKIVQFSGHGSRAALYLEDDSGAHRPVPPSALAELASLMADTVECVILNACFSESQAQEMVRHIPYVIGMRREIEDEAARRFTVGFYMALGAGQPVERAFRYGCQLIGMEGRSGHDVPALLSRERYERPEPSAAPAEEVG